MIYITCALSAEARLFLDYYKLKQYTSLPFKVYESESVKLIITGIGYTNALLATTALLAHFTPSKNDIFLNIGIAAAPTQYPLNSLVVAHKLLYNENTFYPDVLFSHNHEEADLRSVDLAQSYTSDTLVDMEAYGVFQAASRFLHLQQISIIKIISDHFNPESVTKDSILKNFTSNKNDIFELIQQIQAVQNNPIPFNGNELMLINKHQEIFTKSQAQQFLDACYFFHLKHKNVLPLQEISLLKSKRERGEYLETIIQQLTQ